MEKTLSDVLHQPQRVQIQYKRPLLSDMIQLNDSESLYHYILFHIDPLKIDVKQFFWAMFLTRNNYVLGISQIGVGTIHGAYANMREVYQLALMLHASGIVIVHNEPNGSLEINDDDIELTDKMRIACHLLDIKLLDHIRVTSTGYASMNDLGHI